MAYIYTNISKLYKTIINFLIIFCLFNCCFLINISETLSDKDNLQERLDAFNKWYHRINPDYSHLEGYIDSEGDIKLKTNKNIQKDSLLFSAERNKSLISSFNIYEKTKYSSAIKEVEERFGYDDITNMVFFLIIEKHDTNSYWKPYLDILYSKPRTLLHNYWNNKTKIDNILNNHALTKKLFEKKLYLDKKAKGIYAAFVEDNNEVFDKEVFSLENIEWALLTVESRLLYVQWEAFLIPMYDFAEYGVNNSQNFKGNNSKKDDNKLTVSFFSPDNFDAGNSLYNIPTQDSTDLLVSNGKYIDNHYNNCFSLILTFSQRKEDELSKKRAKVFSKYFMFDEEHIDMIYECIGQNNLFSRRLLFFFYVQMMDNNDLEMPDPKRSNLEQDGIILDYAISQFQIILSNLENISNYEEEVKIEQNISIKNAYLYSINQKKMLVDLIAIYKEEYYKLIKEDAL